MNNIIVCETAKNNVNPLLMRGMYRFRHRVFRENLNWDVNSDGGLERDVFDELNPVYVLSTSRAEGVGGCARLLPTTGPYMLSDTFPELLRGESVPRDENVWEISRLAVHRQGQGSKAQIVFSQTTRDLLRTVYDYACEHGIREYVAVCSVVMERFLRSSGVSMTRFGDGKATRIGNVLSVACHIAIDEKTHMAFYDALPEQTLAGAA